MSRILVLEMRILTCNLWEQNITCSNPWAKRSILIGSGRTTIGSTEMYIVCTDISAFALPATCRNRIRFLSIARLRTLKLTTQMKGHNALLLLLHNTFIVNKIITIFWGGFIYRDVLYCKVKHFLSFVRLTTLIALLKLGGFDIAMQ